MHPCRRSSTVLLPGLVELGKSALVIENDDSIEELNSILLVNGIYVSEPRAASSTTPQCGNLATPVVDLVGDAGVDALIGTRHLR